mmetsp:Transcript_22433/g.78621  ORF Transcript_22433/g.78621 Transcript_22433/m.78621 type:complete len:233 (-) Transcript_22433:530-1228(-)
MSSSIRYRCSQCDPTGTHGAAGLSSSSMPSTSSHPNHLRAVACSAGVLSVTTQVPGSVGSQALCSRASLKSIVVDVLGTAVLRVPPGSPGHCTSITNASSTRYRSCGSPLRGVSASPSASRNSGIDADVNPNMCASSCSSTATCATRSSSCTFSALGHTLMCPHVGRSTSSVWHHDAYATVPAPVSPPHKDVCSAVTNATTSAPSTPVPAGSVSHSRSGLAADPSHASCSPR